MGIGHLCYGGPRNFVPDLESLGHGLAIRGSGEPVASRAEVLGDRTIRSEKTLGLPWQLEPLHALLPLAGGLVQKPRAIFEIAALAVLHTRRDLPLCRAIAFELVRDDPLWHVGQALEQLPEEFLCRLLSRQLCTRISSTLPS